MNNFEISKESHFLMQNLDTCLRFTDTINKHIDSIVINLKKNTLADLNASFSILSESLDVFFKLCSELVSAININNKDPKLSLEIKQLNIQHLSIIRSLMYCYKANDLIAFVDLLEYELKDGLTQWKINFIPRLKSQLN